MRAGIREGARARLSRCRAARLLAAVLVFAVACCLPTRAFAADMEISATCPADGATAVPVEGRLWVEFSNNVAVYEDNAGLVSLIDAEGATVGEPLCTVSVPDPEIDFEHRRFVYLDVAGLDAGARYGIRIEPGVTAKNGLALAEGAEVGFTTAAEGEEPVALAQPEATERGTGGGDGMGGGAGGGAAAVGGEPDGSDAASAEARRADEGWSPAVPVFTVLGVAVAFALAAFVRKRLADIPK